MFKYQIVRKDTLDVLETNIKDYKKTLTSRETSIKNLMERIDEIELERDDFRADNIHLRNTVRVIENIIINTDQGMTPTFKLNQIKKQIQLDK